MNNDEFKQLSAAARRANLLDYFQNSGYTVEKKGAEYYGNTAQSPPVGFAQHLLTNFPSYHTETPCNTPVFLRRFYAI